MKHLPIHLQSLLNEVTEKHHPEMHPLLASNVDQLTPEQLLELRDSLADELCETGLAGDDQPNERGVRIEELIEILGSWQMR